MYGEPYRGFESHPLRHQIPESRTITPKAGDEKDEKEVGDSSQTPPSGVCSLMRGVSFFFGERRTMNDQNRSDDVNQSQRNERPAKRSV